MMTNIEEKECLADKAIRKLVIAQDLVWYKEPTELKDDHTWDFKPTKGYLLACYLDNQNEPRYIVTSNGTISSNVVVHRREVFLTELECYASIVENRDRQVPDVRPDL